MKNTTTNNENMVRKTQIMTTITQTREKKTIHPKYCQEVMKPKQKLLEQWKKTRSSSKGSREKKRINTRINTGTDAGTDAWTDAGANARNDKKGK